jgi:hypothetical protein
VRIECQQCRALVTPTWTIDGATIHARCPACGAIARAVATPAAPSPAHHADDRECPKCGQRPVGDDACPRCGLAAARMASWSDAAAVPPELRAAWDACLARWDDDAAHDRVSSLALAMGEQPWLARRYRAIQRERPADPVAATRLAQVGRVAHAAFLATAATPPPAGLRRGSSIALLLVLTGLAVGGLTWVAYLRGRSPPSAPERAVPVHPRSAPEAVAPPPVPASSADSSSTRR